jgi:hypothetical protein
MECGNESEKDFGKASGRESVMAGERAMPKRLRKSQRWAIQEGGLN